MNESAAPALRVLYFDGRSARPQPALLRWRAHGLEVLAEEAPHAPIAEIPHDAVDWPERTRHGQPVAHLTGGGSLQAQDAQAWHDWVGRHGRAESWVVRTQQSWRAVALSLLLVVACLGALWRWGLPWGTELALDWTPRSADQYIGEIAIEAIDESWMKPSALPQARQQRLREAFQSALARQPAGQVPPHQLLFRKSRIGPNAFALPGGAIVMTDELVELMGDDDEVLVGVLAHELGHVERRHGMRMLIQTTAVGLVASLVWGDISSLAAGVPILLGQSGYSRDAEREADQHAATVLRQAGMSTEVMVRFFERMAEYQRKEGHISLGKLGIAISSHPADEERIRFFREAAARR